MLRLNRLKNSKFISNLSWVFFGNLAHAVLSFLLNIYAARSFSLSDMGLYNYAASLTAVGSAICGLGFDVVVTRYFVEEEDRCGSYLGTGAILRAVASVVSVICMVSVSFFRKDSLVEGIVVFLCALTPLLSSFSLVIQWYRYKYRANFVAIIRIVAFLCSAVLKIVAFVSNNLILFAVGGAAEALLLSALLVIELKTRGRMKFSFSMKIAKKMISLSYPFIFSAVLVTIYGQTDKLMLEAMLDYESVAYYTAALTIANVIAVVLASLLEAFRPEIMRYKTSDPAQYENRLAQLYGAVFWCSAAYAIGISCFPELVIKILYGEKYLPATEALGYILWYSSFSYFGAVHNIYMVAEDKTKWVTVLTIVGALLNVVLNAFLIPLTGVAGAAMASLLTQIVANFIIPFAVPALRRTFWIMLRGIALPVFLLKKKR